MWMKRCAIAVLIVISCTACERQAPDRANETASVNRQSAGSTEMGPEIIAPGQSGGLREDRNLVEEGPIDPNSPQGAGQALQSYAAFLEQGRFADARRLWSDRGSADAMPDAALGKYSAIHAEIGAPGEMEGAAGSSYVEIPVRLYGERKSGAQFSSVGTATLRRVNDVPGSTTEQRQWRIYRLDVQPPL